MYMYLSMYRGASKSLGQAACKDGTDGVDEHGVSVNCSMYIHMYIGT